MLTELLVNLALMMCVTDLRLPHAASISSNPDPTLVSLKSLILATPGKHMQGMTDLLGWSTDNDLDSFVLQMLRTDTQFCCILR